MNIMSDKHLPECLCRFLNPLLAGTPRVPEKNEKTRHLVVSIRQDLCRAVTKSEWKLPKHILLCVTPSDSLIAANNYQQPYIN